MVHARNVLQYTFPDGSPRHRFLQLEQQLLQQQHWMKVRVSVVLAGCRLTGGQTPGRLSMTFLCCRLAKRPTGVGPEADHIARAFQPHLGNILGNLRQHAAEDQQVGIRIGTFLHKP